MQDTNTLPRTFFSLQICRGIAALLVVLFHLGRALAAPQYFNAPAFGYIFQSGGAVGVYFFFILSGFIITTVHWRDIGNARCLPNYIFKRLTRVYPIYWVIFTVVLSALALTHHEDLPKDIRVILAALTLIPLDPAVVGGTGAPVIIVAWSLQYEILFYIFFAFLICSRVAGCLAAIAIFSSLLLTAVGIDTPLAFLKSGLLGLFAAGMFTAIAVRKRWGVGAEPYAIVFGVGGLIIAGATASFADAVNFESPAWVIAYGLSASLVVFGLATLEQRGCSVRWQMGIAIGDASYVLYLTHYPIISMVCKASVRAGLSGVAGTATAWLVALCVCIAVAVALHRWLELPLLRLAREPLSGRRKPT